MPEAIRIFVGCAANHEDLESQAVLEYTLTKHASQPIKITWMQQSSNTTSWFYTGGPKGWNTKAWATPFSGFRWALPYMAAAESYDRSIYMDSDFIVFGDIADLWKTPFGDGKAVIAKGGTRFCCSLWHTERALALCMPLADLVRGQDSHARMLATYGRKTSLIQEFSKGNQWNHLDMQRFPLEEVAKRGVKAIHYTRMEQQVQLKHALPRLAAAGKKHWFDRRTQPNDWPGLQELFDQLLAEAVVSGYPLERYMTEPPFGKYHIRGN